MTDDDRADPGIRLATGADAEALIAFNRSMALETEARELDETTVRAGVGRVLADPVHGFYVVATESAAVVGALMVTYEWSDWRNGAFWWVQSVYVRPHARRRGLYRGLYDFVRARAARAGDVCGLRLYVERENHTAQTVYEALGMRPSGYLMYEEML